MGQRAVLFDLDGTLVNSLEDIADAANEVLERLDLPRHPVDAYRYLIGEGLEMLVRRALPPERRNVAEVARVVPLVRAAYAARATRKTRPYPGIPDLLDTLAARAVPFAILTNKPHEPALDLVARLFDGRPFAKVVGARPDHPRKPAPDGALEVAGALGIAPGEWLYLGDTATDMETARAAGMLPVGVLWGFRPAEELREAGAAALIAHPLDALPFLDGGARPA